MSHFYPTRNRDVWRDVVTPRCTPLRAAFTQQGREQLKRDLRSEDTAVRAAAVAKIQEYARAGGNVKDLI